MTLGTRPARPIALLAVTVAAVCSTTCMTAPAASALNVVKPICSAAGLLSGIAGKVCGVAQHPGTLLSAGKKLVTGHVGSAVQTVLGDGSGGGSAASTGIGLAAIGAWVLGGAKFALHETAKVLGASTSPQLQSTWFSSTYWRMAGIAALLTLPFMFAAAVQALMRSDLGMLARATFGYLPLAMLAVSVAAPLTMLLLAASDQMSAIVSAAAGNAGTHFLDRTSLTIGGLTLLSGSPFLAFLVGTFTAAGTIVLWLELLMREAAVYVIVLMLPLVFAALVWPARRIWAIRAVETLVALILSKFAIVAVLALGGAAMSRSTGHSVTGFLAGIVLVMLGAFAPWALIRLMPLSELATSTAGSLRGEAQGIGTAAGKADAGAHWGADWAGSVTAGMRRQAQETPGPSPADDQAPALSDGSAPPAQIASSRTSATALLGPGPGPGDPGDPGDPDAAGAGGDPGPGGAGDRGGAGGGRGDAGGRDSAAGAGAPAPVDPVHAGGTTADGAGPAQRRPGMLPIWQSKDETWELTLGGSDGGSWQPIRNRRDPAEADSAGQREAAAGEDHDSLPPSQTEDEGWL
jgi:hypothetical protein